MDGNEGKTYSNEFYYNLVTNHKVRSQFNGNNNWVHHNIFNGQTTSPARYYGADGSGQAIEMSVYGAQYVSHDNKIDNNLFINTTEAAIVLRSYSGFPNKSVNHLIRNNIFYNTGYKTALPADSGLAIKLTTTVEAFNNTFQNNCIYNPGKPSTSAIKYYGTLMSVGQFNSQNGTSGNVITNNIQLDPMFINNTNDFHLQSTSPCIDSGIIISGLTLDLDGNPIFSGITSDIGPYEFGSSIGINELYNNSQSLVYPNPFTFFATFSFKFELQNAKLKLYNGMGQQVKEESNISGKQFTLLKGDLANGIYFYKFNQNRKTVSAGKIIIE